MNPELGVCYYNMQPANIHLAREITEPPFKLIQLRVGDADVNVVDESPLVGGTKQRYLGRLVAALPHQELVYASTSLGYGAIALGVVGRLYARKVTWFTDSRSAQIKFARELGVNVVVCGELRLHQLVARAQAYVGSDRSKYLFPFGMVGSLRSVEIYSLVLRDENLMKHKPRRMWVAASSGTLVRCLREVFPTTKLMIVNVGKGLDVSDVPNCEVMNCGLSFSQECREVPPYDSPKHYDAKIWPLCVRYAQTGDYIWNAAGRLTAAKVMAAKQAIDAACRLTAMQRSLEDSEKLWPSMCRQMDTPVQMFHELAKTAYAWEATDHLRVCFTDTYNKTSGLSNYYTEDVRVHCISAKLGVSPMIFWQRHQTAIRLLAFSLGRMNASRIIMPDYAAAMNQLGIQHWSTGGRLYAECQTFCPLIAVNVVRRYFDDPTALDVLDPSIGWGDRPLAFLAMRVKSYTGYDPNIDLIAGIKRLIATHNMGTEVRLLFERFTRPDRTYDLVLTSPPFHDQELFQHTRQDAKLPYQAWIEQIYTPYLINAALSVAPGGILALYITDMRHKPLASVARQVVDKTLQFVETLKYTGSYIDPAGIKEESSTKTCLVWRSYGTPPGLCSESSA